jgi:hypothetical protein
VRIFFVRCERGNVEIWTSSITIAEVIRPRESFIPAPLPNWASPALKKFPSIEPRLRLLWDFYSQRTRPTRTLSDAEIKGIKQLVNPNRIRTIQVDDKIANAAVDLSRTVGLKPVDAIHAASAIALHKLKKIEVLQYWDKDYEKVKDGS